MAFGYRPFGTFRFILAFLVLLQHGLFFAPASLRHVVEPIEAGSIAVLLFFVASGFIITESATRFYSGRPWEFLKNRIIRLYPTYLLVILLLFFLGSWLGNPNATEDSAGAAQLAAGDDLWHKLAFAVGNILAILPGAKLLLRQLNVEPLLDLAWALRVEMLFYLGIAVLILLARQFRSIHLWIATASLASLALWTLFPAIVRGNVAQFAPLFVLGMAGYLALVHDDRRIAVASGAVALAALALSLLLIASGSQFHESGFRRNLGGQALLFLAGTVIFFLMARTRELSATFLARDNYLGHLSYPLYMMHAPVLLVAAHLGLEGGLLSLSLVLVACLAAAVLTWHGFEARFDALRSKVRGQRLDPPAGSIATRSCAPSHAS